MLETDYFGYTYTRPPNYVVAGIIEDWQQKHMPIGTLCSKYIVDELTVRNVIHEVLYAEIENKVTIVRKSAV